MDVRITRLDPVRDPRGLVYEPIGPGALPDQRNAHVVITEPGHVRGNHVHREATEILAVLGPARVRYRVGDDQRDVEVEPGAAMAFRFPPGVPHAIQNIGTEPNVIVAFKDRPYDPADPDSAPVELIPTG